MQSFALFYDTLDSDKIITAKLNFNFWTECGWNQSDKKSFLDVGFLVDNIKSVKKIHFFVPFKVCNDEIEDLGSKLGEKKLLSAIFNENFQTLSIENKLIPVLDEEKKKQFSIYTIKDELEINCDMDDQGKENLFKENIYENGTILSLNLFRSDNHIFSDIDNEKVYFRFRIVKKNNEINELLTPFEQKPVGISSLFNTTYTIDFRFFNKRTLGDNLLQVIKQKKIFNIESVHFLLLTQTSVNVLSNTNNTPRKLEKDIWNDYLSQNKTSNLIAYHFKKSFKDENDNDVIKYNNESVDFFIKYNVEKSVFFKYLGFTFCIAIFSSLVASILFCFLENNIKDFFVNLKNTNKSFIFGFLSCFFILGIINLGRKTIEYFSKK